ncbi:MAG: hypothetical protein D6814_15250 [Calditrichaeota bacterium]|nr:MAG: hypothetical protein D6814_15250 [Calditrichota bacterium]
METLIKKKNYLAILCGDRSFGGKVRNVLSNAGYRTKLFRSPERLLAWVNHNPVDVILVGSHQQEARPLAISQIRMRFPLLPILLVADECGIEVIRESLQNGANHFVGDLSDPTVLTSTIDRLIQFRLEYLRYMQVVPHLRTTLELELPSRIELLGGAVFYLTEELFKHGIINLHQINAKIALVEALTNAMEHGNKFDPKKKVYVRAELNYEQAKFDIRDQGKGFDFEALPDPTQKQNLYRPRGRGVFMMRQFMDEVIFHPPGNHVTLIKKRATDGTLPRPYPWERRL